MRPALAGLVVLCTFLVAGCSFGGNEVAERVRQPTLLSAATVAKQPAGSPSRALFAWWRAMQYADTGAAARYYDPALGITSGELEDQLAVATDSFKARPRLMETRDDGGGRATLLVLLESRTKNPNGRVDVLRVPRSFALRRRNGEWGLADNRYLERAVRDQEALAQALRDKAGESAP
jgi:hypothetical protein